jgi:hypothetical protein
MEVSMEAKQIELMIRFIKKLPPEKFLSLTQMLQAKAFIWFAERGIGTQLNEYEIKECFKFSRLNVPTNLGARLRHEYDIVWLEGDKFAINAAVIHEFDEYYEKFLDVGLPDINTMKVKPPNLSQEEISGANKNSETYMLLYLVENSARKWINSQMVQILGKDWWQKIDKIIFPNDNRSEVLKQRDHIRVIKVAAENLKKREGTNKLIKQEEDYLSYCELGDLIDLIRYLANIPGNKVVSQNNAQLISCLKTIDGFRNPIAHNRAITEESFEILKTEYIKWCRLILE